jgi:hypothetical protein
MPLLSDVAIVRFRTLCQVQFAESARLLETEIGKINAQCAARGLIGSSARLQMLDQAAATALRDRAIQIWRNLVRVHQTYGNENAGCAADEFKQMFDDTLRQTYNEIDATLKTAQSLGGVTLTSTTNLEAELGHQINKHAVEIDLYCEDSASRAMDTDKQNTHSYNFYGAVGAVQTGANAVSNITQSIGADEKERLKQALREIQAELTSSSVAPQTREELEQIIGESVAELDQPKPNGLKLTSLLNTVGMAVQTAAAAPQAYQLLKSAVLPLGITLP